MLRKSSEGTSADNVRLWRPGRGGLFRGSGPSAAGRSFEEDLALFERQVREEGLEEPGRLDLARSVGGHPPRGRG